MGATGHKGIDIRQTTARLIFRASLKDTTGAILATGSALLALYELQDDGTLKSFDWADNTFKTTALTTATTALTQRAGNNATVNTGLWTKVLSTLTGFLPGAIYFAVITHSSAVPPQQEREFQFGSIEGDITSVHGGADGGTEFLCVDASAQDMDAHTTPGQLVTKKPDGTTNTAYSPKTLTTNAAALPITKSV